MLLQMLRSCQGGYYPELPGGSRAQGGGGGRSEKIVHLRVVVLAISASSSCCRQDRPAPVPTGPRLADPVNTLHLLHNGAAQLIDPWLSAPELQCSEVRSASILPHSLTVCCLLVLSFSTHYPYMAAARRLKVLSEQNKAQLRRHQMVHGQRHRQRLPSFGSCHSGVTWIVHTLRDGASETTSNSDHSLQRR